MEITVENRQNARHIDKQNQEHDQNKIKTKTIAQRVKGYIFDNPVTNLFVGIIFGLILGIAVPNEFGDIEDEKDLT